MPKTNLYALYDDEAQTVVGPIFAEVRHAPAVRMFNELLADPNTLPGKYPEHFRLIWVGILETEEAIITPHQKPETLLAGKQWLETKRRLEQQSAAPELQPNT